MASMKRVLFLLVLAAASYCITAEVKAAVPTPKYLAQGGSGTTCSSASPCALTAAAINSVATPGDIFLIKTGLHNCSDCFGAGSGITVSGTASLPITLQCENFSAGPTGTGPDCEIHSDGLLTALYLNGVQWWNLQGLHVTQSNNPASDDGSSIYIGNSTNIILRKSIVGKRGGFAHNPSVTGGGSPPVVISGSCSITVEEIDVIGPYTRNGIQWFIGFGKTRNQCQTSPNASRLNYVQGGVPRGSIGVDSGPADGSADYNMGYVRHENEIVEDNHGDGCFTGWSDGTSHFGGIAVNCSLWGFNFGPTPDYGQSILFTGRDLVAINAAYGHAYDPGTLTTQGYVVENITSYNNSSGIAFQAVARNDWWVGSRSIRMANALSPTGGSFTLGQASGGGGWLTPAGTHQLLEYSRSVGNSMTGTGFTQQNIPADVAAGFGSCRIYTPAASPYSAQNKAGKGEIGIGADATKLYVNGVKTTQERFDFTKTGADRGIDPFGPGSKPGVNDPASGNSRYNIHSRVFGFGNGTCLNPPSIIIVTPPVLVNVEKVPARFPITVQVSNATGSTTDWVGIFPVGAAGTAFESWQYMNGSHSAPDSPIINATLNFTAPATPGNYEFRFYRNDSGSPGDLLTTTTFQDFAARVAIGAASSIKINPARSMKVQGGS